MNREVTSDNSLPRAVLYCCASQDGEIFSFAKRVVAQSSVGRDIGHRQTNRASNVYLRVLTTARFRSRRSRRFRVSLPYVLRIEAAELGDGARLQRGLYLVSIVVD